MQLALYEAECRVFPIDTLRLLHTAENHCPAMRATTELRVLHAGLMYSTSLKDFIQTRTQRAVSHCHTNHTHRSKICHFYD